LGASASLHEPARHAGRDGPNPPARPTPANPSRQAWNAGISTSSTRLRDPARSAVARGWRRNRAARRSSSRPCARHVDLLPLAVAVASRKRREHADRGRRGFIIAWGTGMNSARSPSPVGKAACRGDDRAVRERVAALRTVRKRATVQCTCPRSTSAAKGGRSQ
jgi:hypothetical protein